LFFQIGKLKTGKVTRYMTVLFKKNAEKKLKIKQMKKVTSQQRNPGEKENQK